MVALDTQLPNRRAGALTFPMGALDTQLPSSRDGASSGTTWRAEHPSTSGRLPTPDALLSDFQQRGDLLDAETGGSLQRYTNLTDADTVYASQQANTGDRLELHVICCRLPTMRPSPGHRSRTLDLVQTGGLSRSAAASLGQGGTPSGNNLWVATTAQSV